MRIPIIDEKTSVNEMKNYIAFLEKLLNNYEEVLKIIDRVSQKLDANNTKIAMLTIEDVKAITGWSRRRVEELFDDPALKVVHIGKAKQVEASVLKKYFSEAHDADSDVYWNLIRRRAKAA